MLSVQALTAFILLALSVRAQQTPPFIGELLLEPGLNSAKCLTAASNTDGAAVTIQTCSESTAQKWTFTGGAVTLFGNKCLDVTGGNNVDGTKLQILTCSSNNPNQQFSYTRDNRMVWTNKNKCVDLAGGNQADGTPAQIWDCSNGNINQVWNAGYSVNNLPQTSQNGQYGTNNCGTGSDPSSNCQTLWVNSASDFCLWAPPYPGVIGDTERVEVAYCTKSGRGARTFPDGTLKGVHFVKTPEYVQVTGVGNFTKVNIPKGDAGGELDNRGADGNGNPIGGLVYGNAFGTGLQYHDWTSFISDSEFCIRACVGAGATSLCNHIYDLMGCYWNIPANYDADVYEDCDGQTDQPMGVYGTSTWFQGVSPTPTAQPPAPSSNCQPLPSITASPLRRRSGNGLVRRHANPLPFPASIPPPSY
ncbi:carbohydrate-binding module family 13 protein [Phlegmacium glaucopus]|nr:carbohydrate-binding module family 13 protein [Phlegmacium glaucopus]